MKQIVHEEKPYVERGLEENHLDNADKLQKIECPNCNEQMEFYPNTLYWESDGDFEFCDVACPECNEEFELNASAGAFEYEFFTYEEE